MAEPLRLAQKRLLCIVTISVWPLHERIEAGVGGGAGIKEADCSFLLTREHHTMTTVTAENRDSDLKCPLQSATIAQK